MNRSIRVFLVSTLFIFVGCMEQYKPAHDWAVAESESNVANKLSVYLNEDGTLPSFEEVEEAGDENANPIAGKYETFCVSCHGPEGKGNGAAAASLNPKPRNFTKEAWKKLASVDLGKDTNRAWKVLKLGAANAGIEGVKSASMSAWIPPLTDEEAHEMVKYILEF